MAFSPMKVVHLTPAFASAHPYNHQLMDALRHCGVYLKTVKSFNFLAEVLRFKPQIVHVHWLHSFTQSDSDELSLSAVLLNTAKFLAQLWVLRAGGIKIVWTVHELHIPETHHLRLDENTGRVVGKLASAVIAHCNNARATIQHALWKKDAHKVCAIPHGHFIDATENYVSRQSARLQLGIPDSSLVILFFGLLRPYKGVLDLLKAHESLADSNVTLLIVGSYVGHHKQCADYFEEVRKAAAGKSNVRLIAEFIPDNEIQLYMNASDIAAFPYRDIMTSGALIMAMGFGKACIAPKLGCLHETLDDEGAFFYRMDDAEGLIDCLRQAAGQRNRLRAMGEHNLIRARELDWNSVAERTLRVYESVISQD
jgi:beta-1,4-mannosyltransferase